MGLFRKGWKRQFEDKKGTYVYVLSRTSLDVFHNPFWVSTSLISEGSLAHQFVGGDG